MPRLHGIFLCAAFLGASAETVVRFPALDVPSEELRAVSSVHFASPDDPPTLIIHGDQDELVPITMGQSMYSALQDAGVTSEFITVVGAGHGFRGQDADSALAASVAWFEQHLVR